MSTTSIELKKCSEDTLRKKHKKLIKSGVCPDTELRIDSTCYENREQAEFEETQKKSHPEGSCVALKIDIYPASKKIESLEKKIEKYISMASDITINAINKSKTKAETGSKNKKCKSCGSFISAKFGHIDCPVCGEIRYLFSKGELKKFDKFTKKIEECESKIADFLTNRKAYSYSWLLIMDSPSIFPSEGSNE